MTKASTWEQFEQNFHRHFTRDPNQCLALGVERRLDELPDPSLAEARDRCDEAAALLASLSTLEQQPSDFEREIDLGLARRALEAEIHDDGYTWNGHTRLEQLPSAGNDIGDGIFQLLINDPRPAEDRLENIVARLEAVPDYLEALQARLGVPVERWVKMDAEKVAELPGLFESIEQWAAEEGWADRGNLGRACEKAAAALERYNEGLLALATTQQLHVGESTAREIVRLRGIEKSLEELHGIAREFLAENRATLDTLRVRLTEKYGLEHGASIDDVDAALAERFALSLPDGDLDGILARYEVERQRVLAFIRERDLFPIPEDQDMKILRTPGFMTPSIPAGAMMSPPPFREGVRRSLIYLTLSPELMSEHSELHIPSMMIHEGIPGHHLQLSTAATHPSIVRRHTMAMDQAEGWTTMLEDYMLDQGYMGELTDEARFCGKRDIARIGARVAIDLFFMTGDRAYLDVGIDCDSHASDPFEAAGNLLAAVTGFPAGRVQAELNWYSQERGYPLSYLTGNRLVWELKRDVEAAQRGRLAGLDLDRAFHRVYLEAGNMPLSHLRRVFAHEGLL